MPTINAKVIWKPRKVRHCDNCHCGIIGPTIRSYGMAEICDPPWPMYLCLKCVVWYGQYGTDVVKLRQALNTVLMAGWR